MDSTDLSVLRTCVQWLEAGRRVALATVVQTWGSSPRPPGAWLAMRDDGQVVGSVSGGCVEDDLIARIRTEILPRETPEIVTYGVTKEEAARFGLPCGGTLRLVVEPRPDLAGLKALLARIEQKTMTIRELTIDSGEFALLDASRGEGFAFDGDARVMRSFYGPRWRMVLIGAGQLSTYVAQIALGADYEVMIVDPREEFAEGIGIPGVDFRTTMPDDAIVEAGIDNHTAVIALTHDPKLDDMALLEALKSPAFYIGALGSRVNTAKRKERLALFDLTPEEIGRLHGPVGLYIGARTPPEMAISILAEVTAAKYAVPFMQKRELTEGELESRRTSINAMSTA